MGGEIERFKIDFCADCGRPVRQTGGHIHRRFSPVESVEVVRHSDHLAELAAKDEKIEREKQRVGRWEDRCSEAVDDLGEAEEEIERLKGRCQQMVQAQQHTAGELADAEQALPAELKKLAEEFEGRKTNERADRATDGELGRDAAYAVAASRLRERAAELREGAA